MNTETQLEFEFMLALEANIEEQLLLDLGDKAA